MKTEELDLRISEDRALAIKSLKIYICFCANFLDTSTI